MIFELNPKQLKCIKWYFPPTCGGVAQGFNDSGKEFFAAGVPEHVVREIIQNSLDAKSTRYSDRPVTIKMEKIEMDRDIINANEIAKHVEESLKSTTEQQNEKGIKFYNNALKILKKPKIPVLKVIDKNTTGLDGSKWDALVYKEGTPSKDNVAAGGSFGIGKNAPYVASKLSMVCYSTRYLNKHRTEKFIARCKLVAHADPENSDIELQHVGFGTSNKFNGKRYPPILGNEMHKEFRLENSGTGIFIMGFNERNWEKAVRRSIACNFFAAIHDRNLSVQIGDADITNETLNEEYFGDEKQKQYYELYKNANKPIITISGKFGTFNLKISVGRDEMENRVAYINRRGMLVTSEKMPYKNPFSARIEIGKYVAVIWAADDKTDERVRVMEPPTHETIEYKRIMDPDERERTKTELEKIADKIREHIRKELNLDATRQSTALTELSNIIPYISDPNKDNNENSNAEYKKQNETIPIKKIHHKGGITSVSRTEDDGDNSDMPGTGSGAGSGKNKSDNNKTDRKGASIVNMDNVRVVRHGNVIRVAFNSKTGANKFVIYPAGEEEQDEERIKIAHANDVSTVAESITVRDDAIMVNASKGTRVVLDVPLEESSQYTGYSIVEYQTRRKK